MVLWWIGNAILLFVVLPVVIALLNRVLAAVERIRAACDDILADGVELLGEVDRVPELLATTDATVHQIAVGATRYAGSVALLLPPKEAWMPAVAWVTVIIAVLIIAITAVGLLRVVLHLMHVNKTLAALLGGVRAVADRTTTVPTVVGSVNSNLAPVRAWTETV